MIWQAVRGKAFIDGRRVPCGTRHACSKSLPFHRFRLEATATEGLLLLAEPQPDGFVLEGALRFDSRSSAPPEGGFIFHLDYRSEMDYWSLHLPIEKNTFEVWRRGSEGFRCLFQERGYERPRPRELRRFRLESRGDALNFTLGSRVLLADWPFHPLAGVLGMSPKYVRATLWLNGLKRVGGLVRERPGAGSVTGEH